MCNVKTFGAIQTFQDKRDFHECGECSPKVHSGSFHFIGFPLLNYGDINLYKEVETKDDCQVLCDLAKGCNVFNYNAGFKNCHLKYGAGHRSNQSGTVFGKKGQQGHSGSINPRNNHQHGERSERKVDMKKDAGENIYRLFF